MLGRTVSGPEDTGGTTATGDSTAMFLQSSGFLPAPKFEYLGLILINFLPDSIVDWLSVPGSIAMAGLGVTREGLLTLTPVGVEGGVRA